MSVKDAKGSSSEVGKPRRGGSKAQATRAMLIELAAAPRHPAAASATASRPRGLETLARLAYQYPKRRRLRALIVQGAAASLTDEETRDRLRDEQLVHLNEWIVGYERERHRLGIDDSVDLQAAVLYSWAAEVGLGVLEAVGIQPRSRRGWSDVSERFARSLMLPKPSRLATSRKAKGNRGSSKIAKAIT